MVPFHDVRERRRYRTDAEERERVVMKGFMEREMRYAQEMRELEELVRPREGRWEGGRGGF